MNGDILGAYIFGNLLIKTHFKQANAVVGMARIFTFANRRGSAEVVRKRTFFFGPLNYMPLQQVTGAIGGAFSYGSTVFVGAFFAKRHCKSARDYFALKIGK